LGADAGTYASVEFHGPGIAALSTESRFVLPNMMAEMGVKNAWLSNVKYQMSNDKDQTTESESSVSESLISNSPISELLPDADAAYAAQHTFDATTIEPQIACPHSVDNVVPLSQVAGTRVQQAFLGTCTNGRLEDITQAARVIAGRRVATGTRLLVIPASSQVLGEAVRLGYLETLLEAGAVLGTPGCGPCMGNHMGIPAPDEVTISTANRNFRGRMGTREAEIYLASPAVVAASAVAGEIIHPKEL
jgi:3-isopropylmalate/(R)-2-methylmalate dehydratase large subunit